MWWWGAIGFGYEVECLDDGRCCGMITFFKVTWLLDLAYLIVVCSRNRGNIISSSHCGRNGRAAEYFVCDVISLRVIGDRLLIFDSTAFGKKTRQLSLDIANHLSLNEDAKTNICAIVKSFFFFFMNSR